MHFGLDNKTKTTPKQWLAIGADMGELVRGWSGRGDLVAVIGPEAGAATAFFDPRIAEIQVNTDVAFGAATTPKMVGDISATYTQYEFAKATGAIYHEAMHARYTTWDLVASSKNLTVNQNKALHWLEESRIEGMGIKHLPRFRHFLRSCALEIVIGDATAIAGMSSTRAAAQLGTLSIARADAGVLERDDIKAITDVIEPILGDELLEAMREIWLKFQAIRRTTEPGDIEYMYNLAIEFNKLIQDAAEERGEGAEREDGNGSEGDGAEGENSMSDAMAKALSDALGEDADYTGTIAADDLTKQEKSEKDAEAAKEASKDAAAKKDFADKFQQVFKNSDSASASGSRSRCRKEREPEASERRAAVALSKELEKAKYRDRVAVRGQSVTPPGRLRTRIAVQGEAARANGINNPTEPWRKTRRKHADDPNLVLGAMVDISGSMGGAMNAMASTAWILSEAVRRIQGRAGMVYYGEGVFPTLKPGQHLDKVRIFDAADGTERFRLATEALDGALNLTYGTGARLVVVVSDGQYVSAERAYVPIWLRRMEQAGVGVLWIGYGYSGNAEEYAKGFKNVEYIDPGSKTPDQIARDIGHAAAKALTAAGARR